MVPRRPLKLPTIWTAPGEVCDKIHENINHGFMVLVTVGEEALVVLANMEVLNIVSYNGFQM